MARAGGDGKGREGSSERMDVFDTGRRESKRVVRQGFGAAYERFWRFGRVVEGI